MLSLNCYYLIIIITNIIKFLCFLVILVRWYSFVMCDTGMLFCKVHFAHYRINEAGPHLMIQSRISSVEQWLTIVVTCLDRLATADRFGHVFVES